MKFIDLFAGLGGFHLALKGLGHRCVFASEIDTTLQALYKENFGLGPAGDIRDVDSRHIPDHDILCAGFPCQPFSKAGGQQGLACPKWGDLFDHVLRILKHSTPEYLILENVPNLACHNNGGTWAKMEADIRAASYVAQQKRLSPHRFGIPQIRDRMFIVARRKSDADDAPLRDFVWPEECPTSTLSIGTSLDKDPKDARKLQPQLVVCLEAWQRFLDLFPQNQQLPSFPIWSMEFGATYPYEGTTPSRLDRSTLREYLGSHGCSLAALPDDSLLDALPSYARRDEDQFPSWKIEFIRQNRQLYQDHRSWIDRWLPSVLDFPPSLQKFEWNCKGEKRDIWHLVVQIRASGVRVKRPTTSPSLVAMTTTQVPIIAWEKRYMTPRECARLQSMGELPSLPAASTKAFKALGNAVNVELVRKVAIALLPPSPMPRECDDAPASVLVEGVWSQSGC